MVKSKKVLVGTPSSGHGSPSGNPAAEGNQPGDTRKARAKRLGPSNLLIIGYDPAKSSEGGLAAIYNGRLIWCGRVLLWDEEEEEDLCAGLENIREEWLSYDDFNVELTHVHLYYERSQHGPRFMRGSIAVAEAGGAAFPLFKGIFYPKDMLTNRAKRSATVLKDTSLASKRRHPVYPREWRSILGDTQSLPAEDVKALALAHAREVYNYRGKNLNIAEAICIASYGYSQIKANME